MLPLDLDGDDTELMEVWHEQTRSHRPAMGRRSRIIQSYLYDPHLIRRAAQGWEPLAGDKIIDLPSPVLPSMNLAEACAKRTSARRPELAGHIGFEELSALLAITAKSVRQAASAAAPDVVYQFRPYPSAGGLYPCELFVIPYAVDVLDRRPYRYDARRHALIDYACENGRFPAVELDTSREPPPCAFIIAGILDRSVHKYGLRGYRLTCLEAGHLSQNLVLGATAIGLQSLTYGAFCDAELEQWLGLDGLNEVVLSTVLVGQGNLSEAGPPL